MSVGIRFAVALMVPIAVLPGCSVVANGSENKWFNQDEFVGLEDLSSSYDEVTLAYDLDGRDGELISFGSCNDVEATDEADVVESQFSLFRRLYINCLGAKYYHKGFAAKKVYLPSDFSASLVNLLPASVVPNRGGSSLQVENANVLADRAPVEVVGTTGNTFTIKWGATEVDYVLLVKGDVNNDGFQDWVLRLDWAQTDSFGEGTDLIVLTRKSKSGEIEVVRRYP